MPSVKELVRKVKVENSKDVLIFNPDTKDFTVTFHGKEHTIPALKEKSYKTPLANHFIKHLANYILHKKGISAYEPDGLEAIKKEIRVD